MFARVLGEDGEVLEDHAQDTLDRYAALLNPRRENPLSGEDRTAVRGYLQGRSASKEARDAIAKQQAPGMVETDWLQNEKVDALFPRAGHLKNKTWDAAERVDEALSRYDMVNRLDGSPQPVPDGVEMSDPLYGSQASVQYLVQSMGLSVAEAQRILKEMTSSAQGRKNKKGERVTIQPSSALIKPYRKRKMPYRLPAKMAAKMGPYDVLVLMGPPEATPRVMTWRRGNHVDLDMVARHPGELMQVFSRALQSAVLWVGEKPSRGDRAHIWASQVGRNGLIKVWEPGQPLSLATISANLQRGQQNAIPWADTTREATDEVDAYKDAAKKIRRAVRAPTKAEQEQQAPGSPTPAQAAAAAFVATAPVAAPALSVPETTSIRTEPKGEGKTVRAVASKQLVRGPCPKCGVPAGMPCLKVKKGKITDEEISRAHTGRPVIEARAKPKQTELPLRPLQVPLDEGLQEDVEQAEAEVEAEEEGAEAPTGRRLRGTRGRRRGQATEQDPFNKNKNPVVVAQSTTPQMSMAERIKRALGWTGD
jgi:hypothetical protein